MADSSQTKHKHKFDKILAWAERKYPQFSISQEYRQNRKFKKPRHIPKDVDRKTYDNNIVDTYGVTISYPKDMAWVTHVTVLDEIESNSPGHIKQLLREKCDQLLEKIG